ncbi:rod shape-determining protein MreC [Robiginitalea myxolifaciens]|uniref:Cell shape-determining protein MreC n=1 Tax=Robiginitalea myxolifaciens TaxID=400055 RepID=A0A1I6GB14_9FLAO|nr:rod shape-determining protein MreC [Robiginitalea myxolifaciens]SFR39393.1 rod shape-determining protein MreC [Robiginitalea myxolifaciens]
MQRIINFILRNQSSLLYLILMIIALGLTIQNNAYHRSRYFNSANWLTGTVYGASFSMSNYFDLRAENDKLLEENRRLRLLLFNKDSIIPAPQDTTSLDYVISSARIIKNSFSEANNYLTIDKGTNDGVVQDMGVISTEGIVGIVERSSGNYASVQSVLNSKSIINAKIAGTEYFGSLTWNREDFRLVQLEDIPRQVPLEVGDVVVTGGMSSIFPENIPIGTIESFELGESQSFYSIDVRLFNDMTNLKPVYVIRNRNRPEILELQAAEDEF